MKYKVAVLLGLLWANVYSQEFKPYPTADVTSKQWQSYFDEVQSKHSGSAQKIENQKLIVFRDDVTSTSYVFTLPGHAAHPAWITRRPEKRGSSLHMNQIGYFAGNEKPFAELFRAYLSLNDKMIAEIKKANSAKAALISVSHTKVEEGVFELAAKFNSVLDIHAAQATLTSQAKALCASEQYAFGRYSFKASEAVSERSASSRDDSFEFIQRVLCGAIQGIKSSVSPEAPGNWSPTQQNVSDVHRHTLDYFLQLDRGDTASAYAMLSQTMKDSVTLADWQHSKVMFAEKAGKSRALAITKITWYPNSATPSGKATLVAADFSGEFENAATFCGYLVWRLEAKGAYSLVREEVNAIDKLSERKMTKPQVDEFRQKYCKG
jgi:hypothetical protein